MGYFDRDLFTFLAELKAHNDRAWFTANKARYERDVREPCLEFIADVGAALRKISPHVVADPRPVGGSLFRIHRDVRFSKDKSPYKTAIGMQFRVGGRGVHGPGFYLHLEPKACFVTGGMWMPEPDALLKVRTAIAESPAEWKKARGDLDADGGALKRPPRGFPPEHELIEDIKRKSFTASRPLTEKQVMADDFRATFIAACKERVPLMRFLARAVEAPW